MAILELRALAEQTFAAIRELSSDGVGVTRDSYGQGESAAADYLRELAQKENLTVDT
jgi:N-carbamoyl-L-amino-acid hydrolase